MQETYTKANTGDGKMNNRQALITVLARNLDTASPIRFHKYYVTDGTTRARIRYNLDNRTDGRACVTLRAKDYANDALRNIFSAEYENHSDLQTDYFETGKVVLFASHPLYTDARLAAAL